MGDGRAELLTKYWIWGASRNGGPSRQGSSTKDSGDTTRSANGQHYSQYRRSVGVRFFRHSESPDGAHTAHYKVTHTDLGRTRLARRVRPFYSNLDTHSHDSGPLIRSQRP